MLFLISITLSGQIQVEELSRIPFKVDRFIGVDTFGATYYIKNNALHKKQGTIDLQYGNLLFGEPTEVHLTNPLKIVLFYELANTVILLDKFLNEIDRILFNELEDLKLVTHTSVANDQHLWIFDSNTFQLQIFNYRTSQVSYASMPLGQLPLALHGNFNFCWALFPDQLQKYNSYGSMLSNLPNTGYTSIQMLRDKAIFQKENKVLLKLEDQPEQEILLPKMEIKELYGIDDFLYIYDGSFLYHYQMNAPNKK